MKQKDWVILGILFIVMALTGLNYLLHSKENSTDANYGIWYIAGSHYLPSEPYERTDSMYIGNGYYVYMTIKYDCEKISYDYEKRKVK